jgi:large subunit ribosomal protein L3
MKYIIGKKKGMTQIFLEKGQVVPVTVIQANPCTVTQVKGLEKDGYTAVQVGTGSTRKLAKPQTGHLKDLGTFQTLKEFRTENAEDVKRGDVITVDTFEAGDTIKVTGTSKGKGFQGVVKRHGFAGQSATHGTKDQVRMPGSIGATGPAHVFKGTKMAGRMGGDEVTVSGITVVSVNPEANEVYVKGSVPGPKNGIVFLRGEGELKVNTKQEATAEEAPVEAEATTEATSEEQAS